MLTIDQRKKMLLRLWDDKIVEHWDVHTPVPPPEEFQHPNGMY
jgi:predicted SnoaL-like aldol condensation-catalyzing enzyme